MPVAVLVALSLTALGGSGLGNLGSLSQIVSGPRVAGSGVDVDDGDTEIADAVTQLAASRLEGAAGTPGAGGDPGLAPGPGGGQPPAGDSPTFGGGEGEQPGGGDIDAPPPPNDGGGGGGGGGGGEPDPPTPPQPGVVEGVGETVKGVTDGTPLAPTVEDAVDGLVELCGRLGCP